MLLDTQTDHAIAKACPQGRTTCALAYSGWCSVVNLLLFDPRGKSFYAALPGAVNEALREKQVRRPARWRSLNFAKH
jgi:hypothetical protein